MTTFIVGLLVGGAVGYITAALMTTASAEDDKMVDSIGVYDEEEIHENCTVQVWRNTVTGETSVGWWQE